MKLNKTIFKILFPAISLLIFLIISIICYLDRFKIFGNYIYDKFMSYSTQFQTPSKDIVIVGIDRKAIQHFGAMGNIFYNDLLTKLVKYKPKVIVIDDKFFQENSTIDVDRALLADILGARFEEFSKVYNNYNTIVKLNSYSSKMDQKFAKNIYTAGNVIIPFMAPPNSEIYKNNYGSGLFQNDFINQDGVGNNSGGNTSQTDSNINKSLSGVIDGIDLKNALLSGDKLVEQYKASATQTSGFTLNIIHKAANLGYTNHILDTDNTVRNIQFFSGNNNSIIQKIAKIYLGTETENINGKYGIRFYSKPNDRFTYSSFLDIYNLNLIDQNGNTITLSDKIIIIGDYNIGNSDSYITSSHPGETMQSPELIANQIQTFLNKDFINHTQNTTNLIILCIGFIVFVVLIYIIRNYFIGTIIIFCGWQALILGISYFLLNKNTYRNSIYLLILNTLYYLFFISYNGFIHHLEKLKIKSIFSRYVDKTIVNELISKGDIPQTYGEEKDVTILFLDIQGFTSLSEKLKPNELIEILNTFLDKANQIIFAHEGTINKYIGDCIMAFWGAPIADPNQAKNALKCANEINQYLQDCRKDSQNPLSTLNIRIGINSGKVIAGSVGNEKFSEYTVIGDDVNLASRIESINKQYGTNILFTHSCIKNIPENFIYRYVDQIRVKGKENEVQIYELIGIQEEGKIIESKIYNHLDQYTIALRYYHNMNFEKAIEIFEEIVSKCNDKVSKILIERCKKFQQMNKDEITFIHTFDTK